MHGPMAYEGESPKSDSTTRMECRSRFWVKEAFSQYFSPKGATPIVALLLFVFWNVWSES